MGWIEYVEEILIATTTLTIVEIHRNHSEDHHPAQLSDQRDGQSLI